MTDEDDLITLQPDTVAVRYGQSGPDPDGLIVEMFRIELGTDRGPFALALTPAAVVELAQHLLVAYNQLPGERAAWAGRRRNGGGESE